MSERMRIDVSFECDGSYSMNQINEMLEKAGFSDPNCYSIGVVE